MGFNSGFKGLRKSPDTSISLPLCPRGTWNQEGGGASIPGTLIDEWRRTLVVGHLSVTFHEEDLDGGPLYWATRKMRFLRDKRNAL